MPERFVVAFVVGVTPGKWARVWGERLPQHPLDLRPMSASEALASLDSGASDAALLRLPVSNERLSVIPLYEEQPVVVVPKGHVIESVDSVVLGDLAAENLLDAEWAAAVELIAANVGVAVMPQSVARAYSRRDVLARPVTDAPTSRIALAWLTDNQTPLVDEFIGIVRGRTANSSRGSVPDATPDPPRKLPARKVVKPAPRIKFPNKKKR